MAGAYRNADATVSARSAATLSYSDSAIIGATRALFIGAAGNVKVSMVEGGDVTFQGLAAGVILPVQVTKVWATGTTVAAGAILALY